jgi:adenylate cyclase
VTRIPDDPRIETTAQKRDEKPSLWHRISHIGVKPEMTISQRCSAVLLAQAAVVVIISTLGFLSYPGVWKTMMGVCIIGSTLTYTLVFYLLKRDRLSLAQLLFPTSAIFWLTTMVVLAGTHSLLHFHLLSVATGVWLVLSWERRRLVGVVSAVAVTLFLVFEAYPQPDRIGLVAAGDLETFRFGNVCMLVVIQLGLAFHSLHRTHEAEAQLETARLKSENLLLNILPQSIAERLKERQGAIADRFDHATILFADIVNFTSMSERMSPVMLVEMLDAVFSRFDRLCDHYGLEKIKTIGDAYMVAAGIPVPRADHAEAVAKMALDMGRVLSELKEEAFRKLNIRIGIHTGPVVAGVIGHRKFAYDLWGDAVNTASRMESHGAAGRIHVSREVYELLKDRFTFEHRGRIPVKGKGELETWFLVDRR